jgi:hypothetical protein
VSWHIPSCWAIAALAWPTAAASTILARKRFTVVAEAGNLDRARHLLMLAITADTPESTAG